MNFNYPTTLFWIVMILAGFLCQICIIIASRLILIDHIKDLAPNYFLIGSIY